MVDSDAERYDAELDVDYAPPTGELVELLRANLTRWLDYVRAGPSLWELRTKADDIMATIQAATGIPGAEHLAIELALAVDGQFGRLNLGRAWYPRLMSLYGPAVDRMGTLDQSRLFQCLMRHYLHQGDLLRANQVINALLDIAELNPDVQVQEAMLGAASVAASLAQSDDSIVLAEQLLTLAQLTGDRPLMAKTFAVLCQFYANRIDAPRTFEHGQMLFCTGAALNDDRYAVNGLHYMAIAFQLANEPRRAFPYLERALARASRSGDATQLDYLWHTWGSCYYLLGEYEAAEYYLSRGVSVLAGRGTYYATALYMLGLSQMHQDKLAQAIESLTRALDVWAQHKRPFDQLYARHALSDVYWRQGRIAEAVELAESVLAEAETMEHSRRDLLLEALRRDLDKYRAALPDQPKSRSI